MTKINKVPYQEFLTDLKAKIRNSQYEALKKVNKTLLSLYWEIGKDIVEKQEEFGWGKSIVETLSKDLQSEFPGMNGFSPANLWRIRSFYAGYHANEKLAPLVREISWSHNCTL